jgi:hypothetical protein
MFSYKNHGSCSIACLPIHSAQLVRHLNTFWWHRAPSLPPVPQVDSSEKSKYLKGLCVVDEVAFFGIATQQPRDSRDNLSLNCELAAFDLREGLLLWRRQLPTHGLLNIGEWLGGWSGHCWIK